MNPTVSIIIPTFNRCHFIGQTLDTVIAQSYEDWECIIIDDESVDYTRQLLEFYVEKDKRIKFYMRPENRKKGANSCRNFGLEISRGEYINWFDSDDLMSPNFLELKVKQFEEEDIDFVITKSLYFRDPNPKDIVSKNREYYQFENYEITNLNYVKQNINWLTYDFCCKRELAIRANFNESLDSFQERNYFSKITCFSTKAAVINTYVTKVRIHETSIQFQLRQDEDRYYQELRKFFYATWQDLRPIAHAESVSYLFYRNLKYSLQFKTTFLVLFKILGTLLNEGKLRIAFWYTAYQALFLSFNRGNYFRRRILDQYE